MLFDLLGPRTEDARVLDLFAGLGTVGLEALSRGARRAVFVERSRSACRLLTENLTRARCLERAQVMCTTVTRAVGMLEERAERFDVVFVDPPYGHRETAKIVHRLGRGVLVTPDGAVIVEHGPHDTLPDVESLRLMWRRRLGYTILSGYCYEPTQSGRPGSGTTAPLLHHSTIPRLKGDDGREGGHP